jgi:hypothetical protein
MFLRIDCVMFRVEIDAAVVFFYRDVMGLVPRWREGSQAGLDFTLVDMTKRRRPAQEVSDERSD